MQNKNISKLLFSFAIGGLMTFSSCQDYLEVENPSAISQEGVFETVSLTESAMVGLYSRLMGDDSYGSRVSTLYPNAADDFVVAGEHNPQQRQGISGYDVHPDNREIDNPFAEMWKGIERANIIIKYVPLSRLYENGNAAEKAAMRKYHGEALTLRAQFYYELIRNWGDVPAHFEPAADLLDLNLPKTDRDEIYDRLLEDLKLAADLVPWRSESGDPSTRVTKSAVKGLRARIALARGGYSLRRESRQMERGADHLTYYQIARDEALDIIQSGIHRLNPDFETLFKALHPKGVDATNEIVFQAGAFGGGSRTDSKLGYANGIRIDASSKFGHANGLITAVPTYLYEFDSIGDSRRDVTVAYFTIDKDNNKVLVDPRAMREGKFRKYWSGVTGPSQNLGINWPFLRYADVLLMFAEAENELNNGPTPAAVAAFEEVRKRAFTTHHERMGTSPSDKESFFNAIVKERLLEFGGEGIRKYDLIRWNMLEATIFKTRANLEKFMKGEGRYANVPAHIYTINTPFNNADKVPAEMETFNLFGGPIAKVLYEPATGTEPEGYTKIDWRAAIKVANITGYAQAFTPGKSELFPLPTRAINTNYRLTQDYGYGEK